MYWAYPFGMLHLETQLSYCEEAQARKRERKGHREIQRYLDSRCNYNHPPKSLMWNEDILDIPAQQTRSTDELSPPSLGQIEES